MNPIGSWSVLRFIESGSSGEVFAVCAADDPNRRPFALKRWSGYCLAATRAEFEEERETVRLRPGGELTVAFIADGADDEGRPFYVMELLDPVAPPQSFAETKALLDELAGCLAALHAAGYLHRDINENHFGRAADGTLRLLDLGCAVRADKAGLDGKVVGTPDYVAPEVGTRLAYSVRSDVYMLGRALPAFCPPRYRRSFAAVFEHACQFRPEDRPKTAAELRGEILAARYRSDIRTAAKWIAAAAGVIILTAAVAWGVSARNYFNNRSEIKRDDKAVWNAIAAAKLAKAHYGKKNFATAVRLYERAVLTPGYEDAEAYGILAECYLRRQGADQDFEKCRRYAELAASRGDERGRKVLAALTAR